MKKQGTTRRVRRNGRLMRLKRPDAAKNARPKKVSITGHGGSSSTLLRDPLDLRTRVGRAYYAEKQGLAIHVGGDPTVPQEKLIDQAARLGVLADIAWGELLRAGMLVIDGKVAPAFEAFIKASRDQRDVLRALGIERRSKPVPTLDDYLRTQRSDTPPLEAQPISKEITTDAP